MRISVIVVTCNGREWLAPCLKSIPAGVEVIVVDNGSKDGSADEIAALYPSIVLVRNRVNRGFAAAVNQGIERAHGRFICLLNNDARLEPGSLEALADTLEKHPDAGIAAPQLLHEDGRKQNSFDNIPSFATVFLNKTLLRTLFPKTHPSKRQDYADPADVPSVIGACMLVRRELIDRIGSLDERFFVFLEETDWCHRARRAGYRVLFVPQAKVVHLQGKTRDQAAVRGRIEYVRSLFAFLRKYQPAGYPMLRVFYPIKNLFEFVSQSLAAPFSPKARRRWVETAALLGWQGCLCPAKWGLSAAAEPKYLRLANRWTVAEDHLESLPELDRRLGSARTLKDSHHKKVMSCAAGEKRFLIKVYKSDTWLRRIKSWLGGSKAKHELRMSIGLARRGIPTAPVVAIRDQGGESHVVFEELSDWSQLQEVLLSEETGARTRRRLLFDYGRFARWLHDAGVWQYDFNPSNVLVRGNEFKVIDFEKMKLYAGMVPEPVRLHTLAKMNRLPKLFQSDRLRFLRGYLTADGASRGKIRETFSRLRPSIASRGESDALRAVSRCMEENRDFGPFETERHRGFYRKRRPDRNGGLSLEEAQKLSESASNGDYRIETAEDALGSWQTRNAGSGEPRPLAVVLSKGESRGTLVYVKEGTIPAGPV